MAWSKAQLARYRRLGSQSDAPTKYLSKKCEIDGFRFDSLAEGKYYRQLKVLKDQGKIALIVPRVAFPLPGRSRYVSDFMIVWNEREGHCGAFVEFVDVKAWDKKNQKFRDTAMSILKRKQVFDLYGIEVKVVKP